MHRNLLLALLAYSYCKLRFLIQLFIYFRVPRALAKEAAILDAACQCLCVELIFSYSDAQVLPIT